MQFKEAEVIVKPMVNKVVTFFKECDLPVKYSEEFKLAAKRAKLFERHHANDMMAKCILRHDYGHKLAIVFREWVRKQLNPADELEDGGVEKESHEYNTNTLFGVA